MRDRLIELRQESVNGCARNWAEVIADYLLENGVIVPPCKVGDKTFLLLEKDNEKYDIVESECWRISRHKWGDIYSMYVDCEVINNSLEFGSNEFGKTVFLTREEAEAKLKGGAE